MPGLPLKVWEKDAGQTHFQVFSSLVPTPKCFSNQGEELNDEGYDSKRDLPPFAAKK
jgi:hypothetical protein